MTLRLVHSQPTPSFAKPRARYYVRRIDSWYVEHGYAAGWFPAEADWDVFVRALTDGDRMFRAKLTAGDA